MRPREASPASDGPARQGAPAPGSLWPAIAGLALEIEGYELERLQRDVSSDFNRVSTRIRLLGGGLDGVGEDVTYDATDHDAALATGATLPLSGSWTLGSFCDHLAGLDLWPQPPVREPSRHYRVWAYESAALDLALRQAGQPLHALLDRPPAPVRFVVSLRLGTPATTAPLRSRLDRYPDLQFKLDPTNDWTAGLVAEVAGTGAVESVDMKGQYKGTVVDVAPDPELYRMVLGAMPEAWIEDPHDECLELCDPEKVTWDAVIHSVADIEALPFAPRMVNVKPSRLGGLRPLLEAYAYCEERGIRMYGGGQFELGEGRGQIQYLASMFHPDGPNDTAPGGYNDPEPPPGLPTGPLPVACHDVGFRWG